MKADIVNQEGKKVREIDLPSCFTSPVREDVVQRVVEILKSKQPYAPFTEAGKQASASGKIRHARRKWRTSYGKGISRVPRKIMWRRGDQFYWIAAEIASARKGRRAHPPKIESMTKHKKINKKELKLAFISAVSATADKTYLMKRYARLSAENEIKVNLPLIIEGKILQSKEKEFNNILEKILGNLYPLALQEKSLRAGKGKVRGRKYRRSAGMLLVIGNDENLKIGRINYKKVINLGIKDLAQGRLGRLTLYTEKAVEDLAKRFELKQEKQSPLHRRSE